MMKKNKMQNMGAKSQQIRIPLASSKIGVGARP
jgi:hypothetical protein